MLDYILTVILVLKNMEQHPIIFNLCILFVVELQPFERSKLKNISLQIMTKKSRTIKCTIIQKLFLRPGCFVGKINIPYN